MSVNSGSNRSILVVLACLVLVANAFRSGFGVRKGVSSRGQIRMSETVDPQTTFFHAFRVGRGVDPEGIFLGGEKPVVCGRRTDLVA